MKKIIYMMLLILIMPMVVSANEIGEVTRKIELTLNCEYCGEDVSKVAVFQLFANGEPLADKILVLNKKSEYKGSFGELPVFDEENKEIEYEVKYLDGDDYKSIPKDQIKVEKSAIKKWVQVMPEDIKPGHKYVLFTDNWNYESNGFGKFMTITGTMGLEEATVVPEYNIVDGKKSYYVLTSEPSEEAIWETTSVPETDVFYDTFKDYIMFNSFENKRLVLAAYNAGGDLNYMFKQSGKEGYYIANENAFYTNKVKITPIEGTIGRFYISSTAIDFNDEQLEERFAGISHDNTVTTQTVPEYAAQFIAFEYVETEVETIHQIEVGLVLCEQKVLENQTQTPAPVPNPETSVGIAGIILVVILLSGTIYFYTNNKKNALK